MNHQLDKLNKQDTNNNHYQWVRKQQPLVLYILTIICQTYVSVQIFVIIQMFNAYGQLKQTFITILFTSQFRIFVFLINSKYMSSIRGILYGYTMLDILGVLNLTAAAIFIGFELSFTIPYSQAAEPLPMICYMLSLLTYFCLIGNFRVMMATCKWVRWKVILYKLKIYCCCLFLVLIGIYITFQPLNNDDCPACQPGPIDSLFYTCETTCKKVTDCCYDQDNFLKKAFQSINSFYVIMLAAQLAFTSEMIASMSDRDGINQLQLHYTIGLEEESEHLIKQIITKKFLKLKSLSNAANPHEIINSIIKDQHREQQSNNHIIHSTSHNTLLQNTHKQPFPNNTNNRMRKLNTYK